MMTRAELDRLEKRWSAFVAGFEHKGTLEPMQQLKREHCIRVSAEARMLASDEGWPDTEVFLAEAVGLLHDIGRFPQFKTYRSFADAATVDHGDFGAETLCTEKMLRDLAAEPRDLILHAVRFHNKKHLPRQLTAHEEKYLRLIRDADRLDIFFVCCQEIRSGRIHDHPEIMIGVDFNGPPTPGVMDQFERGEAIDYRSMRTMADRFILQLSWVHDLSYAASRKTVLERDVLGQFREVIPSTCDRLKRIFDQTAAFLAEA